MAFRFFSFLAISMWEDSSSEVYAMASLAAVGALLSFGGGMLATEAPPDDIPTTSSLPLLLLLLPASPARRMSC